MDEWAGEWEDKPWQGGRVRKRKKGRKEKTYNDAINS